MFFGVNTVARSPPRRSERLRQRNANSNMDDLINNQPANEEQTTRGEMQPALTSPTQTTTTQSASMTIDTRAQSVPLINLNEAQSAYVNSYGMAQPASTSSLAMTQPVLMSYFGTAQPARTNSLVMTQPATTQPASTVPLVGTQPGSVVPIMSTQSAPAVYVTAPQANWVPHIMPSQTVPMTCVNTSTANTNEIAHDQMIWRLQQQIDQLQTQLLHTNSNQQQMMRTVGTQRMGSNPSTFGYEPSQDIRVAYPQVQNLGVPYLTQQANGMNVTPNVSSMYGANAATVPYTSALRKLQDLPDFSGCAEDWPMFHAAFSHSTAAYAYTNLENNQRLQRSLKGEAKEAVKSLLIHPDNVPSVIQQLAFRFGRPEQLIASQLRHVREVLPITENTLERVVPFATKVRNLAVFLQTLNSQQHIGNPTLLEEMASKLPISKRVEWARYAMNINPYPTVMDFSNWINELAQVMLIVDGGKRNIAAEGRKRVLLFSDKQRDVKKCLLCDQEHELSKCNKFVALNVRQRWDTAKNRKLCFLCLQPGHMTRICKAANCQIQSCNKKHHKLLHEAQPAHNVEAQPAHNGKNEQAVLSCSAVRANPSNILFRILPVVLHGPNKSVKTYAILDEGSSMTMMDSKLTEKLGLRGCKGNVDINWFGGRKTKQSTMMVDLYISGEGAHKRLKLNKVHSIRNTNLPVQSFDLGKLNIDDEILEKLPLRTYDNVKPLLLIGLDNCHLSIPKEVIKLSDSGPYATETELGWVVFGPAYGATEADTCLLLNSSDVTLQDQVTEYFAIESFGVRSAPEPVSESDMRAKRILEATTTKLNDRYQVGLLWKTDNIILPDSYDMALSRLIGIERKMKSDSKFADAYKSIIDDYLQKNYAKKLSTQEAATEVPNVWYLPHFAVVNPNKPGKIRLVFDAAAKSHEVSLNDCLLKGPQQYQPMPSVLFNFRIGAIAIAGDIKEMFHQVLIRPEDRCCQRFLWRNGDCAKNPDVYEMNVMIFGAACSPAAAQHVKVVNALACAEQHPRAVKSILKNHYVDDYVDSFGTAAEAIDVTQTVKSIHSVAGFELRKFVSNSEEVLKALGETEAAQTPLTPDENGLKSEKILGMYWQPASDSFKFVLNCHRISPQIMAGERRPTKRELLSITMSVFDPLGFLSHLMVSAKLLMREVWRLEVNWDEQLPEHISAIWGKWLKNLHQVHEVSVKRCYFACGRPNNLQLHIFVDASEDAFAAVAYWRAVDMNGEVETTLVCAKSRCAPMKTMSVPRMELQAAVLGSRLKQTIVDEHEVKVDKCVLWSDSMTVLRWINSASRRYKQFVAHRISEVLSATEVNEWRWIPTKQNVADEATHLNCKTALTPETRWFSGPAFLLTSEDEWPGQPNETEITDCDEEEVRPKFALIANHAGPTLYERYSTFSSIVRAVAWAKRAANKWLKKSTSVCRYGLTAEELKSAQIALYRQSQYEVFGEDIELIKGGFGVSKGSSLFKLVPYLDDNGVLRVSGRVEAASWLPLDSRNPVILPSLHRLSFLIVMHYHEHMMHQNYEATVCEVRQKYWIPKLRQVVRKVIAECKVCMLKRAAPQNPMMGQLPVDRLTPYVRAFSYTGLDYFGPVTIAVGRRQEKRWVALFTCLTVRAIHLEVAKDLSTDACIIAIRNFINRRGVPVRMRSDNGRNFVGIANDVKTFEEVFDCSRVQSELARRRVEWVFNCPHNPAEGGVWERMVQCVKKVLRHTMKNVVPQEHTFHSLLIEAENVVNSRPLTHIPISVNQDEPLTPNHFLLGSANAMQTDVDENSAVKVDLRKQWNISKQMRVRFWKQWVKEYLPTLTRRAKWCRHTTPLKVGDVVYICDEALPRNEWRKGVIDQVYAGVDGVVRRADVRTTTGVTRRPVSRLAVLDLE